MERAPWAWWRLLRADFRWLLSPSWAPSARWRSRASAARSRARSISPLTQLNGPMSSSAALFMERESDLEAGNGTLQLHGQFRQLADRFGGLFGTLGGLFGDAQDVLHGSRYMGGDGRLLLRVGGDLFNQMGETGGHRRDFGQRLAGGIGKLCSFDHASGRILHGGDGVVGVGLNRLHDGGDLLRRLAGAFVQPLHFLRHHREAAARLAGGGPLGGG